MCCVASYVEAYSCISLAVHLHVKGLLGLGLGLATTDETDQARPGDEREAEEQTKKKRTRHAARSSQRDNNNEVLGTVHPARAAAVHLAPRSEVAPRRACSIDHVPRLVPLDTRHPSEHTCACAVPLPHYLYLTTLVAALKQVWFAMGWAGAVLLGQVANDCLIAIAVEMRDTNALRADGPDNWSILCYGREGGYDYEGTRSVVQNGRFTFRRDDTRAVAMFGCLQVDRHYLSCPLIRYLFTCFEPILRCGGGRAAGMESDWQRMAGQHVNIVVGTLPSTSYEEVVCGDETDAQTNTV
ncbi:uncharacterized protein SEPMUDRAFT_154123 [Sphaerulina musiva SO2202]|uniref:Uncharacterized protein n=1 Tax=Sphaerulina musiva (strain SO2202) TaxID=692275 RepID=M3C4M8_SPHMS|nr:uncharacterized protein SEPMUDRAFT_154123 [Sphaerulina musiva SO2202]EMF15256.1 hypothetical protein SEPMUDRAFT_154123 [Sphaerulina musiva SO2202]